MYSLSRGHEALAGCDSGGNTVWNVCVAPGMELRALHVHGVCPISVAELKGGFWQELEPAWGRGTGKGNCRWT